MIHSIPALTLQSLLYQILRNMQYPSHNLHIGRKAPYLDSDI
nr:MAG TPA: hypothetical protein [Caudoviricetes sp.]